MGAQHMAYGYADDWCGIFSSVKELRKAWAMISIGID